MNEQDATGRIVVGVDGSEPSKEALRWAVNQARVTGSVVEAVMTWEYPSFYGWGPIGEFDFAGSAEKALNETVDEVLGADRPVEVRTSVIEGNAARVLVNVARGAQLLVVGNRGHGGFTEALLGSVGQHCTHHAPCPVTVIRGAVV